MTEGRPNWKTNHPVRSTGRDRSLPSYATAQVYRCLTCGDEHVKQASPTDSKEEIHTGCPECEKRTSHIAVGRALDAYRVFVREEQG